MAKLDHSYKFKANSFETLLPEIEQLSGCTIEGRLVANLKGAINSLLSYMSSPIDVTRIRNLIANLPTENGFRDCVLKCCGNALIELLSPEPDESEGSEE